MPQNFDIEKQIKSKEILELDTIKVKIKKHQKRIYYFWIFLFITLAFYFMIFFTGFLSVILLTAIYFPYKNIIKIKYQVAQMISKPDLPFWLTLGYDEFGLPVTFSDKEWCQHALIPGTTGSGKTTTIMALSDKQAKRGGGIIMVDGKSENPTWIDFYSVFNEHGRGDEVFLLSFRASIEASSSKWNFMMEGVSYQIADMIINLAIGTSEDAGQNKVFVERAKNLCKIVLSALTYKRDIKNEVITVRDLNIAMNFDCLRAITYPSKEAIPEELEQYKEYWIPDDYIERSLTLPAKEPIIQYLNSIGANVSIGKPLNPKQLKGQVGENIKKQHSFAQMEFQEALNDMSNIYGKIFMSKFSDIYLGDIIANNFALYVLVPSLEKGQDSKTTIGKMVVTAIRNACSYMLGASSEGITQELLKDLKRRRARPCFLIILDEYGSYVTPGAQDIFAQARSLGIAILVAIQEYASLEIKGDLKEKKRIISNTNIKVVLKTECPETIEDLKKAAGKRRFLVESSKLESTFKPFDNILDDYVDYQYREEEIIKEEELRKLRDGYGYINYDDFVRKFRSDFKKVKRAKEVNLSKMIPREILKDYVYESFFNTKYKKFFVEDTNINTIENQSSFPLEGNNYRE